MTRPIDLAVVSTHVAPARGYGGPSVSVANLVRRWSDMGLRVGLCSSDASLGTSVTSEDVTSVCSATDIRLYRAHLFRRWGFGLGAPRATWTTVRSASATYVNGIATFPTTLGALCALALGRPYVVSVRGGLMAQHVDLIRRHKKLKWLFYQLLTVPTLRRARAIHCTAVPERDAVLELLRGGHCPTVAVIANGTQLPSPQPPREGPLSLCYAGRVSHEKGINRFLRLWRTWRRADERLVVAGDGAGSYFDEFRSLVDADETVEFRGYLSSSALRTLMTECDFVVLPSGIEEGDLRENFGNSVAEALALGRPALVTRGLAWDELEARGAGFTFTSDEADILRVLDCARGAVRSALGVRAREYAEQHLAIEVTAEAMWRLCQDARVSDA